MILKIVKDFLEPTIDKLNKDRTNLRQINDRSFPKFLDFQFGMSDKSLQSDIFHRFIKWKLLLKNKIRSYNKSCDELDKTIGELKQMGYDEGVINTDKITARNLNPETIETRIVIADEYGNSEKAKLLEDKGLDVKIDEINSLTERTKLDKKARDLIQRLEKIKEKYQDRYDLF